MATKKYNYRANELLTGEKRVVALKVVQMFQELSDFIEANVKPSRLCSMSLTDLEHAGEIAKKAIEQEGVVIPDCAKPEDCCGNNPCTITDTASAHQ